MFCPNCGLKQECGCKSCLPRHPAGTVVEQWMPDGEHLACGGCGLTASGDWWEELSMQVHDLLEKAKMLAAAAAAAVEVVK